MKKEPKRKTLREYRFEDQYKIFKREHVKKYRQQRLEEYHNASTHEQRKLFIAALHDKLPFDAAMEQAGITDKQVAQTIYFRNLKKVTHYELREIDRVK